jgi:hypothetical protein
MVKAVSLKSALTHPKTFPNFSFSQISVTENLWRLGVRIFPGSHISNVTKLHHSFLVLFFGQCGIDRLKLTKWASMLRVEAMASLISEGVPSRISPWIAFLLFMFSFNNIPDWVCFL